MLDSGDKKGKRADIPTGRAALVKSHVALARSIWLTIRGETPSLGMMRAIESMVCVGAAMRVAGARAKTRAMVFVKIIVFVFECGPVVWVNARWVPVKDCQSNDIILAIEPPHC